MDWQQLTTNEQKDATAVLLKWFNSIPEANKDWAEALIHAAIDQTGGDITLATEMAQREYLKDPDGSLALGSVGK